NRFSNRSTTACIASASSTPSVRTVTGVPWPAASSITPMMLLALTSRPFACRVTAQRKGASAWTSLAVARACRPRRLDTVSSRSSIVDDRSIARARRRGGGQFVQSLFRIVHDPQQHWQAQRRDPTDRRAEPCHLGGEVAGAGAVQVGQDQHAVAPVDPPQRRGGGRQELVGVGVERDLEGFRLQRQLAQQGRGHGQEGATDAGMGDQEDATCHGGKLTEHPDRRRAFPRGGAAGGSGGGSVLLAVVGGDLVPALFAGVGGQALEI